MTRIGIIDLGVSNLGSLEAALNRLGCDSISFSRGQSNPQIDALILPGVGSFAEAMRRITSSGLDELISTAHLSGIPVLGICLGMQLLSDRGFEGGETAGLGLLPGDTVQMTSRDASVRLPHVGWNSVSHQNSHPVFENIPKDADFYFVHGFHVDAVPKGNVLGTTTHGTEFCSAASRDNVVGVQFHPEKSQVNGLALLRNFVHLAKAC